MNSINNGNINFYVFSLFYVPIRGESKISEACPHLWQLATHKQS